MKAIYFVLFFCLTSALQAQINLKNLSNRSSEIHYHKINAAQAEQFIKQDSIPFKDFESVKPTYISNKFLDPQIDNLVLGFYIEMFINEGNINANIICKTNLLVYPLVNKQQYIFELRTKEGRFINDATLYANNKKLEPNNEGKFYVLNHRKFKEDDEIFVKVYSLNDTCFSGFSFEEMYRNKHKPFKYTKLGKTILFIPNKVSSIFKKSIQTKKKYFNSYLVFNKPKYKLLDTVKLKAFVFQHNNKTYNMPLDIVMNYYDKGSYKNQFLATINPISDGAYTYTFPLSDSLNNNVSYTINLYKHNTKQRVAQKSFSTEDYILNEATNYHFKINKETFYKNDSIVCSLEAKDANNLNLLDATAQIIIHSTNVNSFEKDSIYASDTVYNKLFNLNTNSSTIQSISTNILVNANSNYSITCIFKNSNNELHEINKNFTYYLLNREIKTSIINDTIYANYYLNGIDTPTKAILKIDGKNDASLEFEIHLPYKIKIDGFYENYDFTLYQNDTIIASSTAKIPKEHFINFAYNNNKDSIGFVLLNTQKLPITYIIFNGNKIVGSGKSSEPNITWKQYISNNNKMLVLKYYYLCNGRQIEKQENLAIPHKLLQIDVESKKNIYPGEKDSIKLAVKDYYNKPVSKANITALSYNTQFEKWNKVADPPYINKYKYRNPKYKGNFNDDSEDVLISQKKDLGNYKAFLKKFCVDTMPYYKLHFTDESKIFYSTPINSFIPQLAVHCVQNGKPQKIFQLYLNLNLVYNCLTTAYAPYSFECANQYTQIAIRLLDKMIFVDSFYAQPNYKHELVLDVDNLPANTRVISKPKYYEKEELALIEKSTLQLHPSMNNAYIWDFSKQASTFNYNYVGNIIAGPFNAFDSLHIYFPSWFDKKFQFEPGYVTTISPTTIKLEKNPLFKYGYRDTNWLVQSNNYKLILGDTIVNPPTIEYPKVINLPRIIENLPSSKTAFSYNEYNKGNIKIKSTSPFKYFVIQKNDTDTGRIILNASMDYIKNLDSGVYELYIINRDWQIGKLLLNIQKNKTLYINTQKIQFLQNDSFIKLIEYKPIAINETLKTESSRKIILNKELKENILISRPAIGKVNLTGNVYDEIGKLAIVGATVSIKGYNYKTTTDREGKFNLTNLARGKYKIVVSSIGYEAFSKEFLLNDLPNKNNIVIILKPDSKALEEVVVSIGYGVSKKMYTGSNTTISAISLFDNQLSGKVAGVNINNLNNNSVIIRGINTLNGNQNNLYIVDGIPQEIMPNPNEIISLEVLKAEEATKIYGNKGNNGVVIISTKRNNKQLRNNFRDYGFWVPNIITNKKGIATFEVNYPDNITSWQNYFIVFDKRGRTGKKSTIVQSYKPVMAQLSTPQFLVEGDSANLIGKSLNYTSDSFCVITNFTTSNYTTTSSNIYLPGNTSKIQNLPIVAFSEDTIKSKFTLHTNTGYTDGEERKIPIFKKGFEETTGKLIILNSDTSFALQSHDNSQYKELYVTNNSLDIWLKDIEWLKNYPHLCMEQTTSKIIGLYNEKQIRNALNQPFKESELLNKLIDKLIKAQQFTGGWAWWSNGKTDSKISNYIVQALLPIKDNKLIDLAVRNGLLFLQNNLDTTNKQLMLSFLYTLSKANQNIAYERYLNSYDFNKINSIHQQWQYIGILQNLNLPYNNLIDSLIKKSNQTYFGEIFWGDQTYRWHNNIIATTTLAYQILEKDGRYKSYLNKIIQYFLQIKKQNIFYNTVEAASITSTILPQILENKKNFMKNAMLKISGDTNFTINSFPFLKKISNKISNITISKEGGGLQYVTLFNKKFNENPIKKTDYFIVNTSFTNEQKQQIEKLQSGKKYNINIQITALNEAEYVQIEVPIPAGCIINQSQEYQSFQTSIYKDKIVFFLNNLGKGKHEFSFSLEARYSGSFHINPTKAELMYFPNFYGNDEIKFVTIEK